MFLESLGEARSRALRLNALKKGVDGYSAASKYTAGVGSGADGKHGAANGGIMADGCLKGQGSIDTGFAHLTKVTWAENCCYYREMDQPGRPFTTPECIIFRNPVPWHLRNCLM